ncbi:MAG TPA: hypothetical protein DCW49_08590, partial [Alteromonas australica]|nr:hypothetical protein [Alteromonas australica]
MFKASDFDANYYLSNNPDVVIAIDNGQFKDATSHFNLFGAKELRAPNSLFSPNYYINKNPDVREAINNEVFKDLFHHYKLFGELENRAPSIGFEGFDSHAYFNSNPDVQDAVSSKIFKSALEHYILFGQFEDRTGTGLPKIFILSDETDNLIGSFANDHFSANTITISSDDMLNGGGGTDVFSLDMASGDFDNLILPAADQFVGIETFVIDLTDIEQNDERDQIVDLSIFEDVTLVKIENGNILDGAFITTILNAQQSLSINQLNTPDSTNDDVGDDGLRISQIGNASSLNITLDDVAPIGNTTNKGVTLEIDNDELRTLNLVLKTENSIVFKTSNSTLAQLNIEGSGTTNMGLLPGSVSNLNATQSNANIAFRTISNNINAITGSGNDEVTLFGGETVINVGIGDDKISISHGSHFINTGLGDDTIAASNGINFINAGEGNDRLAAGGGSNSLQA